MSGAVKAVLVGAVVATVLLAATASARADLRTAHYSNRNPVSTGSATDPQVSSILLQYDSSGTLTAQLHFFHALADSSQTSALHDAYAFVLLGDAYGGDGLPDCETAKAGFYIVVNLGAGLDTTVSDKAFGPPISIPAEATLTQDRTELDITVQAPRFADLNLICWSVNAQNNADTSDQFGFDSGFRLMDGFTPQDGDIAYVGNENLNSEADWVNNNLGHPHNPLFVRGTPFHCRTDNVGSVNCRGSHRMPAIIGKPLLTIGGSQYFTTRTVQGGEQELVWHHDEHAGLHWVRCPAALRPPSVLIGHPCHVTVHWTGTKDLYPLFEAH